ncbi:hypothetical protein F5B18DRAFT_618652 [Nemania serpens]|nr:hypothetical protein F5B18DRAFT_618652 [Nemania serpens]
MSDAIYSGDLGDVLARRVQRDAISWFHLWSRVAHATYAVKEDLTNRGLKPSDIIGDELDAANCNLDSTEAVGERSMKHTIQSRQYEHNEKTKTYFQNVHPDLDVIWENEGGDYSRDDTLDAIDDFNSGTADSEDKKHWVISQRVTKNKNSCSL